MATFGISTEGDGPFPILTVAPTEKVHGHGPFSPAPVRELVETLVALERARCLTSGCRAPAGKLVDTWRLRFQIPAGDAQIVREALTSLLVDGDDLKLRTFVAHPPDLRRRPQPGERWVA